MPDNQKKKKSFSGKIRMYMLVSGAIIILAVSGISCAIMKGYLITQIKSRVAEIAEIAASMVDGDMHKQLKPGDEDTEAYMKIHSDLSLFLGGDFVQYVYTMSETEDGQIQFIVDTDEEEGSDIGEIYDEAFDEMYEALGGKVTTDSDITEDEWGQFLSGYAPIYDSEENVVGFVGVDCLAESVDAECMGFIKKMIFVGIACLIFAFFISMVPSLALKKRLDELNSKLADVVYNDGDLSRRVVLNTGDEFEEVADNLNAMLDQTRTMVESVKDCSLKLQNVAVDVDSTMDDAKCKVGMIAGYLDDMAGSIEVTVSSLEEISSMMDEVSIAVSDMSENSRTGADTAMEISRRSVDMTRNAQNSKEELAEHIERISGELEMMLDRAKAVDEIQSFTEDILEIASQTRLLSLNASIEAARAGEMGKGFAVVAQNIGELAENSGNAASNIQLVSRQVLTLVNEMSELSKQMLDFMQENILVEFGRLTESGDRYAKDATNINSIMSEFIEKMNMIDIAISDVKKAVDVVSEASVTNNEHITEVSHFADELDRQMGHTANMSQQNKSQADNLSGIVDRYSV